MARDVTWRPRDRKQEQHRQRRRLGILGGLIAVNLGVVLYHGDPRDRVPAAPTPARAAPRRPPARVNAPAAKTPTPATTPENAPEASTASTPETSPVATSEGSATATTEAPTPPSTMGMFAVVDKTRTPGVTEELSPTAGMRTPAAVQRVLSLSLGRGQTVAAALVGAGARNDDVSAALQSLKGVVDFRRLRPESQLKARFDADNRLVGLDVFASRTERARAHLSATGWHGHPLDVTVDTVVTMVAGQVRRSLWESLVGAGERPWLITEVVDMFAWDIDFYSEVYPGDTFRLLVEKRYVDGELAGYGALLAGEFVTNKTLHRAFRYTADGGAAAYYDEEGRSLKKQLLKSPLQYGNVTSGFGYRHHPILGYNRRHNGIDYGVPIGTPVWSVGDGHVTRATYDAGFGKFIEVRHPNGWLSQYAHLSRIDVKVGDRVEQKQFIGKVGSTGMSTGPHLHFGLKRFGAYVNPAAQKFERGQALTGSALAAFKAKVDSLIQALNRLSVASGKQRGAHEAG